MQHISQRLLQALGLTGSATYSDARGVNRLPSRAPSEFMHASQGCGVGRRSDVSHLRWFNVLHPGGQINPQKSIETFWVMTRK